MLCMLRIKDKANAICNLQFGNLVWLFALNKTIKGPVSELLCVSSLQVIHTWAPMHLRERSHSQFMSIEICSICQYYYCCTYIVGSKVIMFAAYEIIALKTGTGQVESEL